MATPAPPIAEDRIPDLIGQLSCIGDYYAVRTSGPEVGLRKGNSQDPWLELITINISPHTIYVAFHAAGGDERDYLIDLITEVLNKQGYACFFEEE